MVELDRSQCFSAIVDSEILGLSKPPLRDNVGECVLNTLFSHWKRVRLPEAAGHSDESEESEDGKQESVASAPLLRLFGMSPDTPVIISNTKTGRVLFRSRIGSLSAEDELPRWVENCVLRVRYKPGPSRDTNQKSRPRSPPE